MIARKPVFSSPIRFATGTRTSTKESSAVSEQCQPSFSSRRPTVNPGVPLSITSRLSSPLPGKSVQTAVVTKSARAPLVM